MPLCALVSPSPPTSVGEAGSPVFQRQPCGLGQCDSIWFTSETLPQFCSVVHLIPDAAAEVSLIPADLGPAVSLRDGAEHKDTFPCASPT